MENELVEITNDEIKNLIYTIRGKQVMLDSDVAMLYHYATKNINKAMKRNIERFPEDFCFQLTEEEVENYGGRRYLPYVYTEQGIAMLSGVLKNEISIQVSVSIMRAFVEMREFLSHNGQIFERLSTLEYKQIENEKNFNKVFNLLQGEENIKQKIFYEGQIWDSYSLIIDIIKKAKNKITIIDNKELYHLGASIKDLGKKCFGINKIENIEFIELIKNIV